MTELELKISNLELAIKEHQRLKKLDEETGDVSLVDLEVARRRAEVARDAFYEPASKD